MAGGVGRAFLPAAQQSQCVSITEIWAGRARSGKSYREFML